MVVTSAAYSLGYLASQARRRAFPGQPISEQPNNQGITLPSLSQIKRFTQTTTASLLVPGLIHAQEATDVAGSMPPSPTVGTVVLVLGTLYLYGGTAARVFVAGIRNRLNGNEINLDNHNLINRINETIGAHLANNATRGRIARLPRLPNRFALGNLINTLFVPTVLFIVSRFDPVTPLISDLVILGLSIAVTPLIYRQRAQTILEPIKTLIQQGPLKPDSLTRLIARTSGPLGQKIPTQLGLEHYFDIEADVLSGDRPVHQRGMMRRSLALLTREASTVVMTGREQHRDDRLNGGKERPHVTQAKEAAREFQSAANDLQSLQLAVALKSVRTAEAIEQVHTTACELTAAAQLRTASADPLQYAVLDAETAVATIRTHIDTTHELNSYILQLETALVRAKEAGDALQAEGIQMFCDSIRQWFVNRCELLQTNFQITGMDLLDDIPENSMVLFLVADHGSLWDDFGLNAFFKAFGKYLNTVPVADDDNFYEGALSMFAGLWETFSNGLNPLTRKDDPARHALLMKKWGFNTRNSNHPVIYFQGSRARRTYHQDGTPDSPALFANHNKEQPRMCFQLGGVYAYYEEAKKQDRPLVVVLVDQKGTNNISDKSDSQVVFDKPKTGQDITAALFKTYVFDPSKQQAPRGTDLEEMESSFVARRSAMELLGDRTRTWLKQLSTEGIFEGDIDAAVAKLGKKLSGRRRNAWAALIDDIRTIPPDAIDPRVTTEMPARRFFQLRLATMLSQTKRVRADELNDCIRSARTTSDLFQYDLKFFPIWSRPKSPETDYRARAIREAQALGRPTKASILAHIANRIKPPQYKGKSDAA